jgi:hypothetical protein
VYLESFSIVTAAWLGLVVLAAPLLGAISVIYGLLRRRRSWLVIGVSLIVVPPLALFLASRLARYQERISFTRGDRIATAIESYHEASGSYPTTLSELVPGYLTEVPTSAMGVVRRVPFFYYKDVMSGKGYLLSFPAPAWMFCQRTARASWVCQD